jgi:SAM-dependent methyltransferase
MAPVCPLSGSTDVTLLERLQVRDIVRLYRETLGIETASEFGGVAEIALFRSNPTGLRFFDPPISGSPSFYEQLQRHAWYYAEERGEFAFAADRVQSGQAVLEIGCGKGVFTRYLPAVRYVGLEFNAEAIRKAHARGLTVLHESIEDHATAYPAAYDFVCAFQVLEHVRDIAGFIRASIAALRPGGLLVYAVPSADSFLGWTVNNMLNIPPHHISQWSEPALRAVGACFGLEVQAVLQEPLAVEHRGAYLDAMLEKMVATALGRPPKLLRTGSVYRYGSRALGPLGRRIAPLLLPKRENLIGHSVIAVYRKPLPPTPA